MENTSKPGWSFSVYDLLAVYGWHLLIVAVILVYLYRKAQPTIDKYLAKRAEAEYAAKYHKDPDVALARLAAQQAAVQRLQEKYKADAAEYQRKLEQKEAKKREEWLSKQSGNDGHKLGDRNSSSLKPEYNPLMGDSSRSYRAQRKSPCSGGGCGR